MASTNVSLNHRHHGIMSAGDKREARKPSIAKTYETYTDLKRDLSPYDEQPDDLALDTFNETAFERALWERR